jgi:hypothetical protein
MQDNLDQDNVLRDVQMMGIDPDIPFYDLNLAGSQGVGTPSPLTRRCRTWQIMPILAASLYNSLSGQT